MFHIYWISISSLISVILAQNENVTYLELIENIISESLDFERSMDNLLEIIKMTRSSPESVYTEMIVSVWRDKTEYATNQISKLLAAKYESLYLIDLSTYTDRSLIKKYKVYTWIVLINNEPDFFNINMAWDKDFWYSKSIYILAFMKKNYLRDIDTFYRYFKYLWEKYKIYKILVTFIDDNFESYDRYLPFSLTNDTYGELQTVIFKEFYQESLLNKNQLSIFEDFRNLNKYPIKVIIFPSLMMKFQLNDPYGPSTYENMQFELVDGQALILFKETMNATFEIKIIDKHSDEDDPFNIGLRLTERGDAELVLTGYYVKPYDEFTDFEFTTPVLIDNMCLVTKSTGYVSKSYMPLMPFKKRMIYIFIFYNLVVCVSWIMMKLVTRTFPVTKKTYCLPGVTLLLEEEEVISKLKIKEKILIFFSDLLVLFFQPLPDAKSVSERIFLTGILLLGSIIFGIYSSLLISGLSKPYKNPEITTLRQIVEDDVEIITRYKNLKINAFLGDDPLDESLRNQVKIITTNESVYDYILKTDRVRAQIGRLDTFEFKNLQDYYDNDGHLMLHVINECLNVYSLSYVGNSGSPYLERINNILLRAHQSGLVVKWLNEISYSIVSSEQQQAHLRKLSKKSNQLTMEYYELTFIAYYSGLAVTIVIFMVEIYCSTKRESVLKYRENELNTERSKYIRKILKNIYK